MTVMGDARSVTIDVRQLREVVDGLLRVAEDRFGPRILVDVDCCWLVELGAAFSADHVPGERSDDLGVGQIPDDIESAAQSFTELGDPDGRPTLWHDLEHVTGLLRAIAWIDLPPAD
jgi:hypothetical protein